MIMMTNRSLLQTVLTTMLTPKKTILQFRGTIHTAEKSRKYEYFPRHMLLSVFAGIETLRDPKRADMIALLTEVMSNTAAQRLRQRMLGCTTGRLLLHQRRRVSNTTLESARRCEPGTFGEAYAKFMDSRKFHPADRPPTSVFGLSDSSAYVVLRLREVHDFLHVLFECPTTIEGEIVLKAVEFANCRLALSGLAALLGKVQLAKRSQERLKCQLLPWALRAGTACEPIECIDFESNLHLPLAEVRKKYNIHCLNVSILTGHSKR